MAKKGSILIVDDEEVMRDVLDSLLTSEGYEVELARTGKELIARAIHNMSQRADKPFVTVNSANLPSELLESELFGHLRGAFTGAVAAKKGYFEVADGGSIFLDEIGTISIETQAKLLR